MTRISDTKNHLYIFPLSPVNGGWFILHLLRKCVMHEWLCECKSVTECFSVWMCIFIIYTVWEIHMLLCFMKCMQLLTQLIIQRHSHILVHKVTCVCKKKIIILYTFKSLILHLYVQIRSKTSGHDVWVIYLLGSFAPLCTLPGSCIMQDRGFIVFDQHCVSGM